MMSAIASQYSHVTIGIAWYHANGCKNHITISAERMKVASFQRLNNTSPLITAAIVGLKKVKSPIEAAGFT